MAEIKEIAELLKEMKVYDEDNCGERLTECPAVQKLIEMGILDKEGYFEMSPLATEASEMYEMMI